MSARHVAWIAGLSLMACHQRGAALSITSLSPTSGSTARGEVVEVVVQGQGFDSLNTVHFGVLRLQRVPRRTPTELRFAVPLDDVQQPNRGEAPPRALAAGPYEVRVATTRGTSNPLVFTLNAGGARER